MFENFMNIFKKSKKNKSLSTSSKNTAKERLHLVLMQDRANVSADFLDLMRKEIIEVIKKYIDIDEKSMDVRLTTETNEDGTQGAPALYANIPIINIKDETRKLSKTNQEHKIEIKLTEKKKETENQDTTKDTANEEKQTNTETKEKVNIVEEKPPKKENNKENGKNQNLDNDKEENKTADNQESTKDTNENKEEDNNEE